MDGLAETLSRRTASEVLGRVREVPDACMVYTSWSRIIFPFFWGGISAGTNQSKHGFL